MPYYAPLVDFVAAWLSKVSGFKDFNEFYISTWSLQDLVEGYQCGSFRCTRDQLKQFSRHAVKCSAETRTLRILLSTAARSFRVSSRYYSRKQDCMAPVCFKVVQGPSQKVIKCWGFTQNTVLPACLIHVTLRSQGLFGLATHLFGKRHQWRTLRKWIYMC